MESYIGATGFTEPGQVTRALQTVPERSDRKFMVGVRASAMSLRGVRVRPVGQSRYPAPYRIQEIFPDDLRTLNLVHYAPGEKYREDMVHDLVALCAEAGPRLHGFQLKAVWPQPTMLALYKENHGYANHVIVLQLGRLAVAEMGGRPTAVAQRVREYGALIDAVLVEPSGDMGQPFNVDAARDILAAIADHCPHLGIGVAGGLGPSRLTDAVQLAGEFPHLSIDAEERLRTADGVLDESAVAAYLQQAYATLGNVLCALPA